MWVDLPQWRKRGVRLLKLSAEFGAWGKQRGRLSMDLDSLSWSGQMEQASAGLHAGKSLACSAEMEGQGSWFDFTAAR